MKLAQFQAAIESLDSHASWRDRRAQVAAPLSINSLAVMLTTAAGYHHDARDVLLERLGAMGAKGLDGRWVDDPEVYLGRPWFIGPFLGQVELTLCACDEPVDDGREWFGESSPDPTVPDDLRVQALSDDVTVVLLADHGVAVVSTSKQCEAPAWFRAREEVPAPKVPAPKVPAPKVPA